MTYNRRINIGWSQINITPDRPVFIHGQMYQRVSQYVHDPITATALVLENGSEQVILLSADMTGIRGKILEKLRKNLSDIDDLDPNKLSFSVTHTHNSSNFTEPIKTDSLYIIDKDIMPRIDVPDNVMHGEEAEAFLVDKLTEVVVKAWESRKPGGISYAQDYAVVAFNRRPVFRKNGQKQTVMYGVCDDPSFKGFEGTSDHTADMLYTWDLNGNLTGVAVNIPCPSQVYELHCFITADYWGPTRNAIREKLGNVYVLPLCGAAGDQNPLDLVRLSKNNKKTFKIWGGQTSEVFRNLDMSQECEDIAQRISDCVVRGYKKARNYIENNPVFKHEVLEVELPIRKVTEEEYQEAKAVFESHVKKFSSENRMTMKDVVYLFEPKGVLQRYNLQQKTDVFKFETHVVRLGNIAIATNPFELFTEYGMRIKARSRSEQTFIVQLANGAGGYLPTEEAVAGGSYSSKPASTMCGPDGGDKLVEITVEAINRMWS
jgi:hypothetical protein